MLYEPDGDKIREKNFEYIYDRMCNMYPEAQIIIARDPTDCEEYCRSHSINAGVEEAEHDNILIMDSDIYFEKEPLDQAFSILPKSKFVIPFNMCKDLIPRVSADILSGVKPSYETMWWNTWVDRDIMVNKCAGGGQLITKKFFKKIGGYDERFVGWGYEDTAFCYKIYDKIGEYPILDYTVFHLYHEKVEAKEQVKNRLLCIEILKDLGYDTDWIKIPK